MKDYYTVKYKLWQIAKYNLNLINEKLEIKIIYLESSQTGADKYHLNTMS